MAGTKTLYNSAGLQCGLEVLWRTLGVRVDQGSAECSVQAINGEYARLNVEARPVAVDGSLTSYYGDTEFTYRKMNLDEIIPNDMSYDGEYPATFELLQQFLKFSFDFLLEPNEFTVEGGSATPLKAGDTINVAANGQGQIVLRAHANSCRWIAGGALRLKLLAT